MKILFQFFTLLLVSNTLVAQIDPEIYSKFKEQTVVIDGYKIHLEVKGAGDPILFLPGGPGNSHDYMQGNFGQYYKTNKVIFFDWLGRGKSDNAKNDSEYSVEADVDMMEKIRKHLKLDKMALVGHSYGTVPAQAYTLKYPQRVSKMVLINGFHSGAMWQANCDSYNSYAKTHYPELWAKVDSLRGLGYLSGDGPLKELYGTFPTKYVYYHNTKLKQNVPKERFRGWANEVYVQIIGPDGDFDVSGSMIQQDYRRKLKDVKAPTLIIAGRYDGVSTPEFAVQYKTFMPQARFEMFENSGHNPYLEEPEKFYRLFDEFFGIKTN